MQLTNQQLCHGRTERRFQRGESVCSPAGVHSGYGERSGWIAAPFTDIGYYPAAHNHYRKRVEPIGQWVLIYCRAGKGWYRVGGQQYEVTPNSYFVLPAGMPHEYRGRFLRPMDNLLGALPAAAWLRFCGVWYRGTRGNYPLGPGCWS